MVAPDHKIIIDKGSDYQILIQVPETNMSIKDVRGWTWTFKIYNQGKGPDSPELYKTYSMSCPAYTNDLNSLDYTNDYDEIQAANGWVNIRIDASDTATLLTGISAEVDSFATEYNYRYTIDIVDGNVTPGLDSEEIRILRGRCAIRN